MEALIKATIAALRELRELLWPSDSDEMGIQRGYRDGRDQ